MNWPFWSLSRPAQFLSCESIEPLLSLYADGMASADEARLVEAHLPDCPDCREALSWIQATHRTLAARPIALPPANLHSRIAQAIAASSAAPIKLSPARSFTLRPAYAAAASLTVLGLVLSYSLWHSPAQTPVKQTPKLPRMASVPKPIARPHQAQLPRTVRVKSVRPLVASNAPSVKPITVKRLPTLRKTAPIRLTLPQEQVASRLPIPAAPHTHPVLLRAKTPVHTLPQHNLTASNKIVPAEVLHKTVPVETIAPKLSVSPLVANNHTQEPVTVHILPPTVTAEPPKVQTASETSAPSSKLGDILGPVRTRIGQMRSVAYLTTSRSYRGASHVMQSLDTEHTAYIDGIHSP